MSNLVIAEWQYYSHYPSLDWVFPDGCRDLVMRIKNNGKPSWYLTSLDDSARTAPFAKNELVAGFRFRPGVSIDESRLITSIQGHHYEEIDLASRIEVSTKLCPNIQEALQLLSAEFATVRNTAATLGVSSRTLQRKVLAATGKSPSFWLNLARARQAVDAIQTDRPLADIAAERGYSDQSHLARECKRWFGFTPSQIRNDTDLSSSILVSGYSSCGCL